VPVPVEMSREELIVRVRRQGGRISAQDRQISAMAGQVSELLEANEALAAKLARVEHLLSRNSGNSSSPPSRDGDPGKTPPVEKKRGRVGPVRPRGKQRGAPGSHLGWTENPDEHQDRFPEGRCDCGDDLAAARDLGVVDRYQSHEIPRVAVRVTQYDQHQVRCGCGRMHTADRPEGARVGPVGYGPHLQAFAVYLMVVHFVPAHRVVALLESLTGAAPSVGFVHARARPHRRAARRGARPDPHPDHPVLRGGLRRDPAQGRPQEAEGGQEEGRALGAVMILPILSIVGWCSSSLRGSHVV